MQHRRHGSVVRCGCRVGVDRAARDAAEVPQGFSQETGAALIKPSFETDTHLLEDGEQKILIFFVWLADKPSFHPK